MTGDQAVPLPPGAIEAAAARLRVWFPDEPWQAGESEKVASGVLAAAADVLRAEGAAAERERIRQAILARAIQCRTCGKPHLGYLQPGVDGHPYEARFASPSSSLLDRLADLLDGTP